MMSSAGCYTQRPLDTFQHAMARAGKEFRSDGRCQCPGHDGDGFNLAVREVEGGKLVLHCHSHECTVEQICEGLGLQVRDLFPAGTNNSRTIPSTATIDNKPVTVHETSEAAISVLTWSIQQKGHDVTGPSQKWPYRDRNGDLVGMVIRWDVPGGKEIRQISKKAGGWICRGMKDSRPLYQLDRFAAADSDVIYVVEGEKAADAVASMGLLATSPSQGSKSPKLSDWAPLNEFKRVVILPDRDEPGQKFASTVIRLLQDKAPSAKVEVKHLWDDLPTLEKAGDAYDWSEHYDSLPVENLQKKLYELPDRSGEYESASPGEKGTDSYSEQRTFFGQALGDVDVWGSADTPVEWLVKDVLSADQPTIFGAMQKGLKTTLLTDLAVSLAKGLPWMGRFEIPAPRRVLMIVGEASQRASVRKLRKAADHRNLKREDIGKSIRLETVNFPTLPRLEDCLSIQEAVEAHQIDVVILDPLYMGLEGVQTTNLCEVGPALRRFMRHCQPAKVIIAHHVKKTASFDDAPNLEDLSQAGIAEFAGNFWLMGRMQEYQGDGMHDMAIRYGGRDEQFGLLRLEFNERNWTSHFTNLIDHREHQQQQKANAKVADMKSKIARVLHRSENHEGISAAKLADGCGTKRSRALFVESIEEMEEAGTVVRLADFRTSNNRSCEGYKLA